VRSPSPHQRSISSMLKRHSAPARKPGSCFVRSKRYTVAGCTLPLGTTAKVTNLKTGKSTDVTVTDRGPALGSRKIDLTNKVAKDIGLTRKEGVAPVTIKVTGTPAGAEAIPGR
jgi:rare lipoprotein A